MPEANPNLDALAHVQAMLSKMDADQKSFMLTALCHDLCRQFPLEMPMMLAGVLGNCALAAKALITHTLAFDSNGTALRWGVFIGTGPSATARLRALANLIQEEVETAAHPIEVPSPTEGFPHG